jgi:uncharacterized protein
VMTTLTAQRRLDGTFSLTRIRRMAVEIAREFSPTRIILFGSYAAGTASPDSDVDLLVLFRKTPSRSAALQIRRQVQQGFALDVITMGEGRLAKRLSWGDFFLKDIMASGKVLYESAHA